jgi:hypothetical protein
MANPDLDEAVRTDLVGRLMAARRAVRDAKMPADREAEAAAHKAAATSSGRSAKAAGMVGRRLAGFQSAHGHECEARSLRPPGCHASVIPARSQILAK